MIVFDVSALVSAALKAGSMPERALLLAAETDVFALSRPVWDELDEVLQRPKLAKQITPLRRTHTKESCLHRPRGSIRGVK